MNIQSILLIFIVAFISIKIIFNMYKNRNNQTGGCGGACSSCTRSCHKKMK